MLFKINSLGIFVAIIIGIVFIPTPVLAEHTVISEISISEANKVFSFERKDPYTDIVTITNGAKTMSLNLQHYDHNFMVEFNNFGATLSPTVLIKRHWTGHFDIIIGKPPLKGIQ